MNVFRKNLTLSLTAFAALAALSGCGGAVPFDDDGLAPVEFSIGEPATRSTLQNESAVGHWSLFVFRSEDNGLELSATSSDGGSITRKLQLDKTYRIYAAANTPSGFNAASISSESALFAYASTLGDNASSLVMFGGGEYTIATGQTSQNIPVNRLACRLGVERVTVNMSEPYYASKTFVLKGIWPSNVYTGSALGDDHSAATILSSGAGSWLNPMGTASWDAVTGIDRTIAQGGSYDANCYFYAYPNVLDSAYDNHDATWSPRCTRIVIHATIDGVDNYYLVTIPSMVRNNSYVVTTCTITKPGSRDPEIPTDGAIEVTFSTDTDGWDGPVEVSEES